MKTLFRSFLGLAALLFWAGTLQAQDISRTFDASSGGQLVLDLETGGTIVIRGWSRNQVEVNVEIDGRDADQVTVDFEESSRAIEIFSEFESRRARADVDMEIHVPSTFNLEISTTGGDLDISGISGTIEGSSMGGDLMLSELSGGWQRMALLAAAWIQEPDILLLDEPFAGVDAATETAILDAL